MPSMTVDPAEVAQFDALSTEWWDPRGPFAPCTGSHLYGWTIFAAG